MLLSNPFVSDPRVYAEARTLSENGYDATVIAWDRACAYPEVENRDGIYVRRVCARATFGQGARQALPFLSFWWQAIAMLSQEKVDIVHCHDLDTLFAGWIVARRRGVKLVYDAHECYPAMFASHSEAALLPWLLDRLERFLSRRVDLIVTIGQLLRMRFESMTDRPVAVVGNWKNPDDFAYNAAEVMALSDKLNVNERLVISFLGQFNNDRVIVPLIEAVRQDPDVLLVIAGRGDQEAEIVRLAAEIDNVCFVGMLPMQEVSRYVAVSDVIYYGLNPAYLNNYYSAPNALFSALASGKAVLTTTIGEIARIVAAERCGVVLESLDSDTVLAALHHLKDPRILDVYKRNAARAGVEQYNWANAQQALLASYARLLGNGAPRHGA
jgi:glycosyltransferase involved in cell wall biosynthesis